MLKLTNNPSDIVFPPRYLHLKFIGLGGSAVSPDSPKVAELRRRGVQVSFSARGKPEAEAPAATLACPHFDF